MNATEQSRYDAVQRDNDRLRSKILSMEQYNDSLAISIADRAAKIIRIEHENAALVEQICILRQQLEAFNGLQIITT